MTIFLSTFWDFRRCVVEFLMQKYHYKWPEISLRDWISEWTKFFLLNVKKCTLGSTFLKKYWRMGKNIEINEWNSGKSYFSVAGQNIFTFGKMMKNGVKKSRSSRYFETNPRSNRKWWWPVVFRVLRQADPHSVIGAEIFYWDFRNSIFCFVFNWHDTLVSRQALRWS